MADGKKKRMSMLDSLAAAGSPAPPASMMSSNRALRSARDAVDSHRVWELNPNVIDDTRPADRLEHDDVVDLIDAIETNGQTVPILVRRHPSEPDRYLLVYGRRRLEAVRRSDKVQTVRALVASLDDDAALKSQISENMARRDLSFIEKALFAQRLVEDGFGNQSQVAEVLTVTKSSVSMAISVADAIGPDLARAIGPAHGVGRPRWEALASDIAASAADRAHLIDIADDVHTQARTDAVIEGGGTAQDTSVLAFEAVAKAVSRPPAPPARAASKAPAPLPLKAGGRKAGVLRRTIRGVSIDLDAGGFADWVEAEASEIINELHARWNKRTED